MPPTIKLLNTEAIEAQLTIANKLTTFATSFLTTKKNVAKLYQISVYVLDTWIEKKILLEDIHYTKEGDKINFIPLGLITIPVTIPTIVKKEYIPSGGALEMLK